MALLQNSPFRNPTDKKPLKNKDNFLKKSPNLPFRNSAPKPILDKTIFCLFPNNAFFD